MAESYGRATEAAVGKDLARISHDASLRALDKQEPVLDGRDTPTDLATRDAQLAAITALGIPDPSKLDRLAAIIQPTFVAIGDNDTMMHTSNSQLLADRLPNAHLRVYPDANQGFLNQNPELFADHVGVFLDAARRLASSRRRLPGDQPSTAGRSSARGPCPRARRGPLRPGERGRSRSSRGRDLMTSS